MNKIFAPFLPPWVETGLQPAFYDMESGTVLQQTARMYAKVQQLTRLFNEFSEDVSNEVNNFEHDTNTEIEHFEQATNTEIERFEQATNTEIERFEGVVNDTVAEYIEKFTELKDFVDDYFDNLDVQEEINHKLDQMVEDGVLQEIITTYLQSNVAWTYDSVAEMKTATNLTADSYAQTYGFYSVNDGGEAKYKIRIKGENETPDEKFVISLYDNTLVAELITDDKVNICQVGGQQNFSAVCNYVLGLGKSVYVPDGSYTATETITLNNAETQFICDGDVEMTTANSTFFSVQAEREVIRFNGRVSCPATTVAFAFGGSAKLVRSCNVYIHYVHQSKVALLLCPDGDSSCVQTCQFTFDRLNGTDAAIKFACGDTGQPWCNANVFNGGQVHSAYPIVARKGTNQTDMYNQNIFNEVVLTGNIEIGLDLQFMEKCYFNQIRMSEGHVGTYWIKLDGCQFMHIDNFSYLDIPTIQILNPKGLAYPNYFTSPYIRDSHDAWVGTKMKELNGKFIIEDDGILNTNVATISAIGDNNQTFDTPEFYNNKMIVRIGCESAGLDLRYYLPDIFERRGVTEFYCLVTNKPDTTRLQVWGIDAGWYFSIPAAGAVTNGVYKISIGGKSFTGCPTVKAEKMTLINA